MEFKLAYVLIAVTTILSIVFLRFWRTFFGSRIKSDNAEDLADIYVPDEPGVVSLFLPRSIRRVWHAFVLAVVVFGLGVPHHLILWNFWNGTRLGPWLYFHYVWTLGYWLALLALPAMVITRHRNFVGKRQDNV